MPKPCKRAIHAAGSELAYRFHSVSAAWLSETESMAAIWVLVVASWVVPRERAHSRSASANAGLGAEPAQINVFGSPPRQTRPVCRSSTTIPMCPCLDAISAAAALKRRSWSALHAPGGSPAEALDDGSPARFGEGEWEWEPTTTMV